MGNGVNGCQVGRAVSNQTSSRRFPASAALPGATRYRRSPRSGVEDRIRMVPPAGANPFLRVRWVWLPQRGSANIAQECPAQQGSPGERRRGRRMAPLPRGAAARHPWAMLALPFQGSRTDQSARRRNGFAPLWQSLVAEEYHFWYVWINSPGRWFNLCNRSPPVNSRSWRSGFPLCYRNHGIGMSGLPAAR